MKSLAKYSDHAYALLRIVSGSLFAFHGVQILFGVLSPMPSPAVGTQTWFGGIIELVGGLLVMTGFQTRLAACLCSGTMAVAYFQFHWKFQLGPQIFPAVNNGEMSVLYCFIFLLIACRGAVRWGIDSGQSG